MTTDSDFWFFGGVKTHSGWFLATGTDNGDVGSRNWAGKFGFATRFTSGWLKVSGVKILALYDYPI